MKRQFIKSNVDNNSAKTSPAQRTYLFSDLPKNVQENLLRLQNADGDFLKISSGETGRRVGLLILLILAFTGLAAIVADDSRDLKRIVVFSADALFLLIWFVYFLWRISQTFRSPLKNLIYLTPTQVIETLDGFVRYRELKAGEIVPQRRLRSSGFDYYLNIEFDDGDFYTYWFGNLKKNVQKGEIWAEKALIWKKEAVSAFQRGDTAYLESHNVFSKLSDTNTPVLQRKSRTHTENLLLIMTIALIILSGGFIYLLSK